VNVTETEPESLIDPALENVPDCVLELVKAFRSPIISLPPLPPEAASGTITKKAASAATTAEIQILLFIFPPPF
jgi:hypothetical protein